MLRNAVRDQQRTKETQNQPSQTAALAPQQQQQQSQTLSQQIFSSSPPVATAAAFAGTSRAGIGRSGRGQGQQSGIGTNGKILQPSPTSLINLNGRTTTAPFKNPLKRSSSSISGASETAGSNNARSFSSNGKRQGMSAPTRQASGVLGKLHSDFSFDENDMISDADMLLLAEQQDSKPQPKVHYPEINIPEPHHPSLRSQPSQPNTPSTKTPRARSQHDSSAPYPWSSSPDTHCLPALPSYKTAHTSYESPLPIKKQLLGRQLEDTIRKPAVGSSGGNEDTKIQAGNRETPINLDTSPIAAVPKQRTLPWKKQQEEEEEDFEEPGSKRMRRPKQEKVNLASTPAPKKKDNVTEIWDQTPNAVKAEQKRFRQEQAEISSVKTKPAANEQEQPKAGLTLKATTKGKALAPVYLSEEQQRVLNLVVERKKNVFFTGSAGTGKSVLMREIISHLRKKYEKSPESVAVTASTGLAACNIGGNTLHSFAGIGLGKESVEQLVKKIKKQGKSLQRWQRTKVLIIDEISMIDGALFDKLEAIARIVRKRPVPFGGIQIVITGDFFQLPPVAQGGQSSFTFDAACWKTTIDHTIGLTHVFRQKDPVFAGMLNEMRIGKLSPASIQAFHRLNRPIKMSDGDTEATELFPTKSEVEMSNANRMKRLMGTTMEYDAVDAGALKDPQQRAKLLANCMAPQKLILKKGAQVMLIKNIDDSLVNGSIGKVVAFMTERMFDYYDAHEEEFVDSDPQVDANGNVNVTVNANMDVPGQAGSNSLPDLQQFANPGANDKGRPTGGNDSGIRYPVVRFQVADGSTRDLLCQPESWKMEQPTGEVLVSRSQIPLILAWALSIHKAQGQTLEKVKVDLGRVFEKGQAYVALSRATTQEGLQVSRFDPRKVMAHERVRTFYDTLYGVETICGMPKNTVGTAAGSGGKLAGSGGGNNTAKGPRALPGVTGTTIPVDDEFDFSLAEEELIASMNH